MADDLLDLSPLFEISQSLAGQAAVDLQTVDKGGDGDEAVGLDILVELLGGRLLKDDGVLGLVLNCWFVSSCPALNIHRARSCSHIQAVSKIVDILLFSSQSTKDLEPLTEDMG